MTIRSFAAVNAVLSSVFVVCALLCMPVAVTQAQEVKRTELKRSDLTGTNMEIIVTMMEAPPGSIVPRHFHYGEETFYVLEGATIEIPGQPQRQLASASSGIVPREMPHSGYKVVGDKTLKVLTVHTVDKGKPLFADAK
jgi:quercetin dioxygenase-like cupin family protein